jgi:ACR3 family arsenite efflux pump ArsB
MHCRRLVLLFGVHGEQTMREPLVIAMLAVPILIQVYFLPVGLSDASASSGVWPGRQP